VDFSQEKMFLTAGYLEMMWKRLDFLRLVLEKGYSFIFLVNIHDMLLPILLHQA
jgi:hypothetical protein